MEKDVVMYLNVFEAEVFRGVILQIVNWDTDRMESIHTAIQYLARQEFHRPEGHYLKSFETSAVLLGYLAEKLPELIAVGDRFVTHDEDTISILALINTVYRGVMADITSRVEN
jgi:hypothetical protein